MVKRPEDPEMLLHKESLDRIYDESTLEPIVQSVLDETPSAILDYKSGKQEAFNFLVGNVMRKTRGRGDAETIRRILLRKLK